MTTIADLLHHRARFRVHATKTEFTVLAMHGADVLSRASAGDLVSAFEVVLRNLSERGKNE